MARTPSKWAVLGIVGIGVFMCTLDASIVNVTLPAIARYFGVEVGAAIEWVIIAYLVIIAALLLTIGRLADRIGHKPIVAPISGHFADRIGTRGLAAAGMTLLCLGLLALAHLDDDTSRWGIVWPQLVAALGQGLFQSPNNSAIMGAAPRDRQGVAAGMLATGRTMGQSVSVAIAGAVFTSLGRGLTGVRAALIVCAAIAAIGIFASLLRGAQVRSFEPSPTG